MFLPSPTHAPLAREVFPLPRWINLETPDGKLIARFDRFRGILEIVQRREKHIFDLAQLVYPEEPPTKLETLHETPPPPSPT